MEEEREFRFSNQFLGPESLRPFAEYSSKKKGTEGTYYCIYCGARANTREYVPSKVFLKKPLPSDLPVLPACEKCNNGFSSDELYTKTYIECLKTVFINSNLDYLHVVASDRKEIREAKASIKKVFDQKQLVFDDRVGRVLLKLAIGHAVYELTEGYYSLSCDGNPLYIKYIIRSTVSEEEWSSLEYAEVMNEKMMPEIGSRVFRNLIVLPLSLKSIEGNSASSLNLFMMDWTDIQDGEYRYIAYVEEDKLIVKMIIMDFLYGEIAFQRRDSKIIENK